VSNKSNPIHGHPGLRLRSANNTDIPALRKLIYGILSQHQLKPDPQNTDADLNNLEEYYAGGYFVVMETENMIIGSVALSPRDHCSVELRKMYLHADWRGQGLGRLLLDKALCEARRQNIRRVILETAETLKTAITMYQRAGFRPLQVEHLSPRCDQAWVLEF
jgi:putative acetyltransferase|tara:strand:+ start:5140 stop:5628 length:489 start_codon:yes stop_codon:yes gene_type:complete